MALLFMLVCMLAASSVLMAAGSNSGKLRSNQQEQQKYLELASALRSVCAELTAAEYVGQYEYYREDVPAYDPEGNIIGVAYRVHTFKQLPGQFKCGLTEGGLDALLPLGADLDALLAANFQLSAADKQPGDVYNYTPGAGSFGGAYRLELQPVAESLGIEWNKVQINGKMRTDGVIRLTATLGGSSGGGVYSMEAELTPQENLAGILRLVKEPNIGINNYTSAVKWNLNWIAKKEAA